MHKDGQLPTLDIDLEEINIVDLGNIIQPLCQYSHMTDYAGIVLEEIEDLKGGPTGHERARPTGIGTEVQRVLLAIAYRIRKVSFVDSLFLVQFHNGRRLGVKAGDAA